MGGPWPLAKPLKQGSYRVRRRYLWVLCLRDPALIYLALANVLTQ